MFGPQRVHTGTEGGQAGVPKKKGCNAGYRADTENESCVCEQVAKQKCKLEQRCKFVHVLPAEGQKDGGLCDTLSRKHIPTLTLLLLVVFGAEQPIPLSKSLRIGTKYTNY